MVPSGQQLSSRQTQRSGSVTVAGASWWPGGQQASPSQRQAPSSHVKPLGQTASLEQTQAPVLDEATKPAGQVG